MVRELEDYVVEAVVRPTFDLDGLAVFVDEAAVAGAGLAVRLDEVGPLREVAEVAK
jgi:hypothetical protein